MAQKGLRVTANLAFCMQACGMGWAFAQVRPWFKANSLVLLSNKQMKNGGAKGIRTPDLLHAIYGHSRMHQRFRNMASSLTSVNVR
jgi:hypothetical protein